MNPINPDVAEIAYRLPSGEMRTQLLSSADEVRLSLAAARALPLDGNATHFQLACEAQRIDFAFLFDPMMAVHTSGVDPLPHQIAAVYDSMLPRQPLRFVLADDPGAGKTIMAGLYMQELLLRADARRILIVAPGSLVEQWRDELFEKFGLDFAVFSPDLDRAAQGGDAFAHFPRMIARLDQLSRNDELRSRACRIDWDLVVFDEAHKLAAHFQGSDIEKTDRFKFAEELGARTRHLLLMTATPHNGKEEEFQLFLSLLDSDRFYGRFRDGVHKVDTSDIMRRMVKEELIRFDGTPLFPERRANTVNYTLSDPEAALYERVTEYVRTEMGKADALDGQRKGAVGFALTALQRRLASSPEAIFQSLARRRKRLATRLTEEKFAERGRSVLADALKLLEDEDERADATDVGETAEDTLVDQASAARTRTELQAEIRTLEELEAMAREIVLSGKDRKWEELSRLLQDSPEMRDADGQRRRLILFTEHRDTLAYLQARIASLLGNPDAIVTIHGGTHRDERKRAQARFRSDKDVRVLIATDAAGEGVNLQCANLMVNYDLPWNPNRLEQRFGRIHRIGQTEVCHLWSLVAKETREGAVWHRLLEKLAAECAALDGKVFNILGEVFEDRSLKDLIIEAIRSSETPEVRARLAEKIDHAFDHEHLRRLLERGALASETISPERLYRIRDDMEKAEARRLQPHFIREYFLHAFDMLGGRAMKREAGRWEITYVPPQLGERDRLITGRNRRNSEPIMPRYERICFDRDAVQPAGRARAELMHPGHPLMLAVTDVVLEKYSVALRRGAVFVDPSDDGLTPRMLMLLRHDVRSGDDATLSSRLQFVHVDPAGGAEFAGWASHLDLEPLPDADRSLVESIVRAPWLAADLEDRAIACAAISLAQNHFREIAERRTDYVDRTLAAVNERLTKEIDFWSDRAIRLRDDLAAGRNVQLNIDQAARRLQEMQQRLESRKRELQAMRNVQNTVPIVLGGALVVPIGLLRKLRGEEDAPPPPDAMERREIERIAMQAVLDAERARGHAVTDVSAEKCGWDVTSQPPAMNGVLPPPRHIEVKGRAAGADTITVTRSEIRYALNQADKFLLAVVFVLPDGTPDGPHYVHRPFTREPDRGVASVNYELAALLAER